MSVYSIPLKIISTNHIIIDAKVNNIDGIFLIDTGASNSCIDYNKFEKFKLNLQKSDELALSATDEIKEIYISKKNSILISEWLTDDVEIILFDMKQIVKSLKEKDNIEIDGILGSDFLINSEARIDFKKKY